MSDAQQSDLAEMAQDELARALSLPWRDLAKITPWGDAYDGFSPAGRPVTVERSYIWAEAAGGDILVEIVVYGGPSRYEDGARAEHIVPRDARR